MSDGVCDETALLPHGNDEAPMFVHICYQLKKRVNPLISLLSIAGYILGGMLH
jgi:hypothetical protein